MILITSLLLFSSLYSSYADCIPSEMTIDIIPSYTDITFNGFDPEIERFSGSGMGNKIILKNFKAKPIVTKGAKGIVVEAGEVCTEQSIESAGYSVLGLSSYFLGASPFFTIASMFMSLVPLASAADDSECGGSITVEIYTDTDAMIMNEFKAGECPPESFYWKHHESVFGGYEGCVGEKYLLPCGQDAQGANDESLYSKTPINWNGEECEETGYSYSNRTFWILWGDPLDKAELLARTGLNPVVKIPFIRGPYPSYTHGTDETVEYYDDANTAKAVAKDFLVYLGAMPESERNSWYVSMTEGAENGISVLWASKTLEIAQTTCNRDIYVLMEAPAYGYSNGEIASWVNKYSDTFYSGEECLCFPDCNEKTVTVNNVGFFPPNIPSRLGGDNVTYPATSNSPNSPWFESMVFPENPSGTVKIPQIPDSNRRVCDGVYVWPMYFYFNDFEIPLDDRPDCSGWSFAITKGYSASARVGFITYKKEPQAWVDALSMVLGTVNTISHGLFSQWSWMGQMQIQQMMMSKPVDDPTSWIGAYSSIMKEKWDVVADGFKDCPVLDLSNKGKGAYAFFVYKEPYTGLQDSFISSFFLDVLGVSATTYYWGFRGADPSDFYGPGISTYDFTRMQLYRDLNVYIEVARRAKIVCADTSASIGDYLSIDDWKLAAEGTGRGRKLEEAVPHLRGRKLELLSDNIEKRAEYKKKAETCAPDYSTGCLFKNVGARFRDQVHTLE